MERLLAQVKVLHCQTVREQEAQSKGDAARHGLEQPSARHPVRKASEHDSPRQVGETAGNVRSQVRQERNQVAAGACRVVKWGSKR